MKLAARAQPCACAEGNQARTWQCAATAWPSKPTGATAAELLPPLLLLLLPSLATSWPSLRSTTSTSSCSTAGMCAVSPYIQPYMQLCWTIAHTGYAVMPLNQYTLVRSHGSK